jgi:hypothetical protein
MNAERKKVDDAGNLVHVSGKIKGCYGLDVDLKTEGRIVIWSTDKFGDVRDERFSVDLSAVVDEVMSELGEISPKRLRALAAKFEELGGKLSDHADKIAAANPEYDFDADDRLYDEHFSGW